MKKVLVIGASSAIAQATARILARDGAAFYLVARDPQKLRAVADDLRVRGAAGVDEACLDALDYARHGALVETAIQSLNGLDLVLIAHGSLPDQKVCEQDFEAVRNAFEVNTLSILSLTTHLAGHFQRQGRGSLVVVSSVAGDRGRQSNYVYGAAKGALSIFLQGLRNRLHPHGVQVLTVKPGFVDSPMTKDFAKGPLWATPERIGRDIVGALGSGRMVLYSPWYWRWIMASIRALPERVFARLRL